MRRHQAVSLVALISFAAVAAACDPDDPHFTDAGPEVDAPVDLTAPETTLSTTPAVLTNLAETRFEFSSDRSDATFRCALDGEAAAGCTSPHVITVAEGGHTFAVFAVSAADVADASPAEHTWEVDLTPPDTTITTAPPALDNSVDVSFEFDATEDATFACTFDGGAPAPCTSPHAVTGLADGAHELQVLATDLAGNVETAPAVHAWTLDSSAPDTTIDTGPTGFVSSAGATFTFSSPDAGAGATLTCALDAGAFAACTSPRTLSGLGQGAHTFQVRVRDAVGNLDPTPATRTWTVDTMAPTVTITAGPNGATSDATPTFSFTTGGAPTVTQCRVGTGAFVACASPHTTAGLADGSHTFEVQVTDAAGNRGTATRGFTVDTQAPTVTITGGPTGVTGDNTPTFTFTVAGAPTTTTCAVGAQSGPCSATFTATALADGGHTFSVVVADAAGNTGMATRAFSVDTGAPTVTITGGPTGPTNDPTPTFTFTTTGSPTSTTCTVGAQSGACSGTFTPTALGDGSYSFTVNVADAAGNTGSATRAFVVDTVGPTVTITGGPTGPTNDTTPTFTFTTTGAPTSTTCTVGAQSGACTGTFTPAALANGSFTFTVTVADAAGNTGMATRAFSVDTVGPTVTITGGPTGPTTDTTPTFTFTTAGAPASTTCTVGAQSGACSGTFTPTALGDGSYTFTVSVADAAGNTGSASRSFSVDTQPPTVTITSGPSGPTNDSTPTWGFTTAGAPTSTTCRIGTGAPVACTTSFTSTLLADGGHTFTVTVTDAAGLTGSATRSIAIDTVAPTVDIGGGPTSTVYNPTTVFRWSSGGNTITECRNYPAGAPQGAYFPCFSAWTYSVTFPVYPPNQFASWTFEVRVRDDAGNAASDTWNYTTGIFL